MGNQGIRLIVDNSAARDQIVTDDAHRFLALYYLSTVGRISEDDLRERVKKPMRQIGGKIIDEICSFLEIAGMELGKSGMTQDRDLYLSTALFVRKTAMDYKVYRDIYELRVVGNKK